VKVMRLKTLLITSAAFKSPCSVSLIADLDKLDIHSALAPTQENVMFTTHVRPLGYGTQAMPIDGSLSIPKASGTPLVSLEASWHGGKVG
jgi:hypothetical protein